MTCLSRLVLLGAACHAWGCGFFLASAVCDQAEDCAADERCSATGFCEPKGPSLDEEEALDAGREPEDSGVQADAAVFDAGRERPMDAGLDGGEDIEAGPDGGVLRCAPEASYSVRARVGDSAIDIELNCVGAAHEFVDATPNPNVSLSSPNSRLTITPLENASLALTVRMLDADGALIATSAVSVEIFPADWWDFTYRQRVPLAFPRADAGRLDRLPVHVVLDDEVAPLPADGAELRFAQRFTHLPFELMAHSADSSRLWLLVDRFGSEEDTVYLYLDPGPDDVPLRRPETDVWSDYALVFHLGDKLTNSVNGQSIDAIFGNAQGFDTAPGVFGAQFADTNLGAEFSAVVPDGTFTSELTTTLWGRFQSPQTDVPIVRLRAGANCTGSRVYELDMRAGVIGGNLSLVSEIGSPSGTRGGPDHDAQPRTFWGGGATMLGPSVFVLFSSFTRANGLSGTPDLSAGRCIQVSSLAPRFLGELDEVRVSATLRSPPFVNAERETANPDFVVLGAPQSAFP